LYFYGTIYRLISNHLRQSPYLNLINYIYFTLTSRTCSTFDVDRPRFSRLRLFLGLDYRERLFLKLLRQ
jgi:hypothetical protein